MPPSQAIAAADVLLIAAGAGFSADSGLPVYDSIAADACYAAMGVTYSDLCNPLLMAENPELFYGFWGTCGNQYQSAPLHAGYALLNRWAEQAQRRPQTAADVQPCWVYTSNVDGSVLSLCQCLSAVTTCRSVPSLQRTCRRPHRSTRLLQRVGVQWNLGLLLRWQRRRRRCASL